MKLPKEELTFILAQFNPWWRQSAISDLPQWKRAVFNELFMWVSNPPAHRAIMLSGPRQVGKTTLILQTIDLLLKQGVQPGNILYITFDHPIFKIVGLEAILDAWRELEPKAEGAEYLFLDEAQFIPGFGTWIKHQIDFSKHRKIVFTGSAMPLSNIDQESGVGRWHTIQIATLSFYEYLQIKQIPLPTIPNLNKLSDLFSYSTLELLKITDAAQNLIGHFHEYLCKGGFPQTALVENVSQAQRLLREDIIDKVLKRDMTALFGVRRVIELEQLFIYLCMHDGGIQDSTTLSNNLGVTRPTINNYINLLENAHLLYRLPPYGYGKDILRARNKLYLADPAIAPSILMKGKSILEEPNALGHSVETAIATHLAGHCRENHIRLSYWLSPKDKELDIIAEMGSSLTPIEVKYQTQTTVLRDIQGLTEFCSQKTAIQEGYVITKSPNDVGSIETKSTRIMRIPGCLLCYWIGESEIQQKNIL